MFLDRCRRSLDRLWDTTVDSQLLSAVRTQTAAVHYHAIRGRTWHIARRSDIQQFTLVTTVPSKISLTVAGAAKTQSSGGASAVLVASVTKSPRAGVLARRTVSLVAHTLSFACAYAALIADVGGPTRALLTTVCTPIAIVANTGFISRDALPMATAYLTVVSTTARLIAPLACVEIRTVARTSVRIAYAVATARQQGAIRQ